MKHRILIIGAGFFQTDGIIKAREMGHYVIAIDGNPNAYGKDYADEFACMDIVDKQTVLKFAKEKNIIAAASISSEVSMDTLGYVVSELKLKGYTSEQLALAHDKSKYFQLFLDYGINIPWTKNYVSGLSLEKDAHYYVKPSEGSGSRGVVKIKGDDKFDFENYKKENLKPNEKIVVQKEVKGREITVDGIIINNDFTLLAISEQFNNEKARHNFSSELIFPPEWLTNEQVKSVSNSCDMVAKAMSLSRNGPIHLEFIIANDELYLIDFSLRGGGFDVFTKIIKKTSGIDALDLYFKSVTGHEIEITLPKIYKPVSLSFVYPDRGGIISKLDANGNEGSHENHFFSFIYDEGDEIEYPTSGRQRVGYFICWGETYEEVYKIRDKIHDDVSIEIV